MSLVLDSEGLSLLVLRDRRITTYLAAARKRDEPVVASAATLVEVRHPKINQAAFRWAVSRLTVVPVTEALALVASDLLAKAGVHGHKHAIDAMVAATALTAADPTAVLTSDPDDFSLLCRDAGIPIISIT
jgi:predicted nucleic acid-binding protein